jgi:alpha-galactosidase
MRTTAALLAICAVWFLLSTVSEAQSTAAPEPTAQRQPAPEIRTPPPGDAPRINGPRLYGQRPGRPFLYTIPVTGIDPIKISVEGLPDGLTLEDALPRISGTVERPGDYPLTITATNSAGADTQKLLVRIGDQICLTPPMGWNSWNCFAGAVDEEKVFAQAKVLADTGLIKHGWTYVNIDDTWQGKRSGPDLALQPNEKFPDMKGLCDRIHALGLKAGIYSTPWTTSYARFCGGSSENADGSWSPPINGRLPSGASAHSVASHHFMAVDARQWAAWGFDYLKYDWNPITIPDVAEMADALRASGRDIVFSLSNHATYEHAADYAALANCWRTTGDITDTWASMHGIGFSQDRWSAFAGNGHWNDPDMLVVGTVGWGHLRNTKLTPDEQYTHITLWCLLSAPLLLGTDLTKIDDFTHGLLCNDEVLAVDQDALGHQATQITQSGPQVVYAKHLADGTWAVGLFNLDEQPAPVTVRLGDLELSGPQPVRDLWRQKDLPESRGSLKLTVAPHGAELVKIGAPTR